MFVYGQIFPSSAKEIIKVTKSSFKKVEDRFPLLKKVKVSTSRTLPGGTHSDLELVLQPMSGNLSYEGTAKLQSFNAFIFGKDESDVDELARLSEAIFSAVVGVEKIRWIRIDLASQEWEVEQDFARLFTFTASIKGEDFNLTA